MRASATSPRQGKVVAIVQSNYIPWKGYLDLIAYVDEFILYDDAQYTRRDWRNRNRIKTPQGLHWLTIPVKVKGRYHQCIKDTVVSDTKWNDRHWLTLAHHYAQAQFFQAYRDQLEELYRGCRERYLSLINHRFLTALTRWLGIDTRITCSMDYQLTGDRTERLLCLCQQAGATEYVSGPAARAYLDESLFGEAGVNVSWMSYEGYPEYHQLHPPFEHKVSVLDLLLHTGAEAGAHMRHVREQGGMKQAQHPRAYA